MDVRGTVNTGFLMGKVEEVIEKQVNDKTLTRIKMYVEKKRNNGQYVSKLTIRVSMLQDIRVSKGDVIMCYGRIESYTKQLDCGHNTKIATMWAYEIIPITIGGKLQNDLYMNRIVMQGRCGQDAKTWTSKNGNNFCTVSIATAHKSPEDETTTWHDLCFFGKRAEWAVNAMKKGVKTTVLGEVEDRQRQGRDCSCMVNNQTITVNHFNYERQGGPDGAYDQGSPYETKPDSQYNSSNTNNYDDDDIPF